MEHEAPKKEGLRERKRRETRRRIAEEGLRLFAENGYDATTLETVAAEARISARTLFYYFKTKDEILHFWQGSGFLEALGPTLLAQKREQEPLEAVCHCLLQLISRYDTPESVIVDRVLNASETLRMRKQLIYLQMEQTVFAALLRALAAADAACVLADGRDDGDRCGTPGGRGAQRGRRVSPSRTLFERRIREASEGDKGLTLIHARSLVRMMVAACGDQAGGGRKMTLCSPAAFTTAAGSGMPWST